MKKNLLYTGDCLEIMESLPDNSIDLILCDLPYGTTKIGWDTIIPFDQLWEQYERILKPEGAAVLFAAQPFTSTLIASNLQMFKYSLVWQKSRVSHFAQAPYRFLTIHEDICIFSKGGTSKNAKIRMNYNPQGLKDCDIKMPVKEKYSDHRPGTKHRPAYTQSKTGYPKSILKFPSPGNPWHPTQKPIEIYEYLVRTFSNEGDVVLDNCAGSLPLYTACKNSSRNFVMCEKDEKYISEARKRFPDLTIENFQPVDKIMEAACLEILLDTIYKKR